MPPVADQRRNQRIDLVRERLVAAAHAAAEFEPVEIERLARAQVDHAADTALDQIGGRRLVDINAAEQFGRAILKIDTPAATGSENVRSAARQVGTEGVRTWRSRWSP